MISLITETKRIFNVVNKEMVGWNGYKHEFMVSCSVEASRNKAWFFLVWELCNCLQLGVVFWVG